MLFNTLDYLLFFPTVVGIYFLLPHRLRWLLLLIASYTFYMFWRAEYAILLIISTLIDYTCGRMMGRYSDEEKHRRKPWLWLSLLSNLGILFTFKYYNFFSTAAVDLAGILGVKYAAPALKVLLPMGISFYTFQTMSYSIDVYFGRIKAERHLGIFALFVTFFPQLVAGPIERAGNLINQLKKRHEFNDQNLINGLMRIGWGLFKKVVIADRLAYFVDYVYNYPTYYAGIPLLLTTILFAFQIYCDFSGYSDMAIGSAQVMGFRLMENFRRPYFSKSIKEFWSRWHISLSTWFRDYLYIPLGGNRVVKWRWYYNLFVVFMVSGLWHGANWTFIVWGALHGIYIVISEILPTQRSNLVWLPYLAGIWRMGQVVLTFGLTCFAWIFFRANSIEDAFYIITHITKETRHGVAVAPISDLQSLLDGSYLGQPIPMFLLALCYVMLLMLAEAVREHVDLRSWFWKQPLIIRWGFAYALLIVLFVSGIFNSNEFIYFQF